MCVCDCVIIKIIPLMDVVVSTPLPPLFAYRHNSFIISSFFSDGEDFVLMEDELTFEPGMLHQCIAVRIVDDEILEATESFSLVFNNSKSLSVVLGLDTVTIEILDDDGMLM